jgi:hypothetical protein
MTADLVGGDQSAATSARLAPNFTVGFKSRNAACMCLCGN